MKEIMWGLPVEAWRLGFTTETNTINSLGKIKNTKVEKLNQNTNELNNCRGNPAINNHMYGIIDMVRQKNTLKSAHRVQARSIPPEDLNYSSYMESLSRKPIGQK